MAALNYHDNVRFATPASDYPLRTTRTGTNARGRRRENCVMNRRHAVQALAIVFAVLTCVVLGIRGVVSLSSVRLSQQSVPIVSIRVQTGDSAWKLAQRYGNKDQYILDRIDAIYSLNGLSEDSVLHAGQILRVPVTNIRVAQSLKTVKTQYVASLR